MKIKRTFNNYKRAVTPPYTKKDVLPILLTLFFLLMIPLTLILLNQQTNLFSRAASLEEIEPENGTRSGPVSVITDTSVSAGKYIQFNAPITPTSPPLTPTPVTETLPTACNFPYKRLVKVSTTTALNNAVSSALPGDMIVMADGTYAGRTNISISGTATDRITLCGNKAAKIAGTGVTSGGGSVIALKASYWNLSGFTATNSLLGVIIAGGNHNTIQGLEVYNLGQEAIQVHSFSSDNLVQNNYIHDTGKYVREYGEGVYIGSAKSNWPTYSNSLPDTSNNNKVIGNTIGPNVTAEHVDVKEGVNGGVIDGNHFDGTGMTAYQDGKFWVDSWVVVQGKGFQVNNNYGKNSWHHGYQSYNEQNIEGSGTYNTFSGNTAENIDTDSTGTSYGVVVSTGLTGVVVRCNNVLIGPGSLTNVTCQP